MTDESAIDSSPMPTLEHFSSIIIDVLKELSTERQPLTSITLSKALAEREESVRLWGEVALPGVRHPASMQIAGPPAAVGKLEDQRRRDREMQMAREIDELEAQVFEMQGFYKKIVLSLIPLASKTDNFELAKSLGDLRQAILEGANIETLKASFQNLKGAVLKEDPECMNDVRGTPKSGPFWVNWWKGRTSRQGSDAPPAEPGFNASRVQEVYLRILDQYQFLCTQSQIERFFELRARISAADDLNVLLELGDAIARFIQEDLSHIADERSQLADFVMDLGKNLLEMEGLLQTSLSDAQATFRANERLNDILDGQVEEMERSATFTGTLEEMRSLIFSKLMAIKAALAEKRLQDDQLLFSARKRVEDLQENIQNMRAEVEEVQRRSRILEKEVLLDSLTGIYNRRAYEARIRDELERYRRYKRPFSLILIDVDHFKAVNDAYGHRAGDKCLKEIINRIKKGLRKCDFLARYGGEEFVIILPETAREGGFLLAERLRVMIEKTHFRHGGKKIPVTISLGATQVEDSDMTPESIFSRVDSAMYRAKSEGRNRVHLV